MRGGGDQTGPVSHVQECYCLCLGRYYKTCSSQPTDELVCNSGERRTFNKLRRGEKNIQPKYKGSPLSLAMGDAVAVTSSVSVSEDRTHSDLVASPSTRCPRFHCRFFSLSFFTLSSSFLSSDPRLRNGLKRQEQFGMVKGSKQHLEWTT